jgi:hypothetical protein
VVGEAVVWVVDFVGGSVPDRVKGCRVKIAYADPPYPGCAHLYKDHPDYAGEVDHARLVYDLVHRYDGYCLHTSSVALADVLARFQIETNDMPRVMAWVKPFAAFKRNVSVAYAWEPVLVRAARKPVVKSGMTYRDWVAESITMKRGLTGAKPERVCRWLFEVMGCEPGDELCDLYPGTGAVVRAWEAWWTQMTISDEAVA